MKKRMKKLATLMMAVVMAVSAMPANIYAATNYTCSTYETCTDGGEIYIINKDNCPIRKEPHNKGKVVARGTKGELVSVKRVFKTKKKTTWCELNVEGSKEKLYVFIDNVKKHDKHSMIQLVETKKGGIAFCPVCGYAAASNGKKTAQCDLKCIGDQALKGSFSNETATFTSIAAQVLVGEIPFVGTAADVRDLLGDIWKGESLGVIGLDAMALVPVVGAVKYSKHLDKLKYADEVKDAIKYLPWGTWNDYKHVKKAGKEYAQIGDFLYTQHAVEEFLNPSNVLVGTRQSDNFLKQVGHARGVPPTWVNYVITDGVKDGVTKVVPNAKHANRKDYICGSLTVVVEGGNKVITIITK